LQVNPFCLFTREIFPAFYDYITIFWVEFYCEANVSIFMNPPEIGQKSKNCFSKGALRFGSVNIQRFDAPPTPYILALTHGLIVATAKR
jgi:hypothetical protein